MIKNLLLIFTSVLLGVAGQLSLKHGMTTVGQIDLDVSSTPMMLLRSFTNPYVLLGFIMYGVSSLSWLIVLSRVELSLAYPMISIGYVLVVFLSWMIFAEHVTLLRFLGTLVICFGVFLISRTY
jgi:multidrug transporter EmrE-like cation transporter